MRNIEQILPGTLCVDISTRQMSAIELGISLGQKIQADFPEIGSLYKEGFSLSRLISKFNIVSYLGVNFKVAETATHRALMVILKILISSLIKDYFLMKS